LEPGAPTELIAELRQRHARRLHNWLARDEKLFPEKRRESDAHRHLRIAMVAAEREAVIALRDEGKIGDPVLWVLQRDFDFESMLLELDDDRHVGPHHGEEEA